MHGILQRLKAGTQLWHDRLEHGLDLSRTDFTRPEYSNLLGRFYGYYAPWERQAAQRFPALLDGRWKTPLLERDLRFLGIVTASLPQCQEIPPLDTLPATLGAMYVLEGATLGGQYITRQLKPQLELTDGQGIAFFSSYGSETGSRWKAFQTILQEHSSAAHDAEMIRSAVSTFESMYIWLRGRVPA